MKRSLFIFALLIAGCGNDVDISSLYSEGSAAFNEKRFDEAEKKFLSVIRSDADFLNAYLMLAKIRYYNRGFAEAASILDEIIERDPDHAGALYWKARALVMSDPDTVELPVELLEKVLETHSSHIPARLLLSLLYEKKGNHREAMQQYITVLREEENLISARGNLAILYMRLGLRERGRSEIEKALKIAGITGYGAESIKTIKREFDKWEK